MNSRLLNGLACPADRARFQVVRGTADSSEELECLACKHKYPIVRGIPRFVTSNNYAASFGEQWNRFAQVQLDSKNGTTFSRDRFYSITEWQPSALRNRLVLDVGCGAGRFAEIALNAGAEVVGVDLSSAVDAAQANLGSNPRFHCLQASIYDLPLADATFDYVYCIGVIQHTPDPRAAVQSILPKVKIGGGVGFWIYERDWKAFVGTLGFKYLLRPITRRLSFEQIEASSTHLERMLWPILGWSRSRGQLGRVLMRLLPLSSAHLHGVPLQEKDFREWVRLDTIDMYSPAHDHPQTFARVRQWLEEANFEVDPRHSHGGISITAKRLS
jgi:2-polyprenyl-3-methyl-5-hydroxy-6-metoxy-1,4-benzoquinol methylase